MWHSWCVVTSSIVPALKTFQSKGIAPSYVLGQLHEERGGWTYNMSYVLCAIVSGDITRLSIDPFCTFVLCHNLVSTADEILVFVELLQDCHFVMFVIIYPQLSTEQLSIQQFDTSRDE